MATRATGLWTSVLLVACLVFVIHGPGGADPSVVATRLTLAQDDGKADLTAVDRAQSPELFFRVSLQNVPLGAPLNLTGAWVDPRGRTVRTNRWQTRPVDHLPWTTYCRCQLTPSDVPGQWHVSMWLGGHPIADKTFSVR